jgi:hypothetical protein
MEIKVHHVIASDTDSAYFTLTKLIQKLYPDSDSWPREKRIEALLKITDKIQERANTILNQYPINSLISNQNTTLCSNKR